jgi:hypothetical protein
MKSFLPNSGEMEAPQKAFNQTIGSNHCNCQEVGSGSFLLAGSEANSDYPTYNTSMSCI